MVDSRGWVNVIKIAYVNIPIFKKPIIMFFICPHIAYFNWFLFIIAVIKCLNKKICYFIRLTKQRYSCNPIMDCVNLQSYPAAQLFIVLIHISNFMSSLYKMTITFSRINSAA